MYLGIDIGTSGVKGVLLDDMQNIVTQASVPLDVSRPFPLWSEQDPEDWWQAVLEIFKKLIAESPDAMIQLRAIGLSGQMHGAVLLDRNGAVLRPAILWNDGRAALECVALEEGVENFRDISGNIAMPGFTAPKLLWVQKNEPDIFAQIYKILLPKDYIRYRLTGEFYTDMSDAAGTLWLDVKNRCWSEKLLAACGLNLSHMPLLVEGDQAAGRINTDLAKILGVSQHVLCAGGAGDNAATAAGLGVMADQDAFLSLGTSGVLFFSNDQYQANTESAVHSFCHCVPDKWHQMSVMLSAASCIDWAVAVLGYENVEHLLTDVTHSNLDTDILFLPYLSGERTPHNDPNAKGVFFGMGHGTTRAEMALAVLEGVGFAFRDGLEALNNEDSKIENLIVSGGGTRSKFWGQILANILGYALVYYKEATVGAAFGAARLAICATGKKREAVLHKPQEVEAIVQVQSNKTVSYHQKFKRFQRLYQALKTEFQS